MSGTYPRGNLISTNCICNIPICKCGFVLQYWKLVLEYCEFWGDTVHKENSETHSLQRYSLCPYRWILQTGPSMGL